MSTNVFISFRASDGLDYKKELDEVFSDDVKVRNYSENEDRSNMSEDTIQDYLYRKLKETSLTIVILTPDAVNYKKDWYGKYDDWMYDEIKYSLDDRTDNRTNAVLALYTPSAKDMLFSVSTHECSICGEKSSVNSMKNFDNLVRKNMMNVYDKFKTNKCEGIYDSIADSYISLVSFEEFTNNYLHYIDKSVEKRSRLDNFDIKKRM